MIRKPFRSSWLSLGVLLVIPVAAIAIAVGMVSYRDQKWAALESRVDKLFMELQISNLERVPLGRSLLPGNAWEDYAAASASPDDRRVRLFSPISLWLRKDPKANPAEAMSLISEFSPRIEMISKGARRQTSKPPTPARTAGGLRSSTFQWYGNETLALVCVGKARLLSESGNQPEALSLLIDVGLFGRDLAASPDPLAVSSAMGVIEIAFLEIREMLQHQQIGREDLKRLDSDLALLDDYFSDNTNACLLGLFQFGDLLIREDRAGAELTGHADRPRRSWRTCFSARLHAVSAFNEAESITRRAIALQSQPYSVAGPGYRMLGQEHHKSSVLEHGFGFPGPRPSMQARSHLRLLRVAARYLASGQVPELEDPAGGKISTRLLDNSLLIWMRPSWPFYGTPGWEPKEGERGYEFNVTIEVPWSR